MAKPIAAVGIVLVAHMAGVAEGVRTLAAQMAPEVDIRAVGGTDDGGVGTSFDAILDAIQGARADAGVVVLYDLGSAQLTAELVLETLDPEQADRVLLSTRRWWRVRSRPRPPPPGERAWPTSLPRRGRRTSPPPRRAWPRPRSRRRSGTRVRSSARARRCATRPDCTPGRRRRWHVWSGVRRSGHGRPPRGARRGRGRRARRGRPGSARGCRDRGRRDRRTPGQPWTPFSLWPTRDSASWARKRRQRCRWRPDARRPEQPAPAEAPSLARCGASAPRPAWWWHRPGTCVVPNPGCRRPAARTTRPPSAAGWPPPSTG